MGWVPARRLARASAGRKRGIMKFLVICAGGNIRSRAFVHHLMYRLGFEALSASHDRQTDGTLALLFDWADRIVVVQPQYAARVTPDHRHKVKVLDVGPDEFGSPWHFILQYKIQCLISEWAKSGFAVGQEADYTIEDGSRWPMRGCP